MIPVQEFREPVADERELVEKETWGQPPAVRYVFRLEGAPARGVFCAYSAELTPWPYLSSSSYGRQEAVRGDEAWFFSKEQQASETEADSDIEAGRIAVFDDLDDLMRDLRS